MLTSYNIIMYLLREAILILLCSPVYSFTVVFKHNAGFSTSALKSYKQLDRRTYVTSSLVTFLPILANPSASRASDYSTVFVDDLSIPAEVDVSSDDSARAAMQERIRKKMELQKKASTQMNFNESLAAEKEKQKKMKRSKEEMRAALCEELGRGC